MNVTYIKDDFKYAVNYLRSRGGIEVHRYDMPNDGFYVWLDAHGSMYAARRRREGVMFTGDHFCHPGGVNSVGLYIGVAGPDKHTFGEAVAAMLSIEFGTDIPYVKWSK